MYTNKLAEELHKPAIKKFKRRSVIVNNVNDIWGSDLVDMREWAEENHGYNYLLTIIDILSKYAYAIPLKNKTGINIVDSFKKIITNKNKPNKLWVDQGSEFYNKDFKKYLKDNNIDMYSSFGDHKSAVIERFNRTLKTKMWKYFTAKNTRKYIDVIDDLIKDYNNTVHKTIKMKPIDAIKDHNFSNLIINYTSKTNKPIDEKPKFKVGDYVRISRIKQTFEKGYIPNFSREIFIIKKKLDTYPVTYKLTEYDGKTDIDGSFYEQELLKTDLVDVFEVEKVLQKRKYKGKKQEYVKWLGWPEKYNSWIDV